MTGMMLTNPRLAFYLAMAGAVIAGAVIGYILARVGLQRRIGKKIDEHTGNALSKRDAQLAACLETISEREAQIAGYRVRFKAMVVFLAKAVETAGGIENV